MPYSKPDKAAWGRRRRVQMRAVITEYLKSHPCVDCDNNDVRVLDFDHVRGKKLFNIKSGLWLGWTALFREIEKCAVRCANCHRIRHYKDRR